MQPTRQEYILKSEVIKIAEKLIEKIKDADEANDGFLPHYRTYPTASIKELLSELDNLSGVNPVEIIKGRLQELNNTDYDNYCSAIDVGARKKELEELLQKFNPSSNV